MSVRSAVAQQQGVDEQMLGAVDHYETSEMAASQRAALRLADTYLTRPAEMSDAVRQEVAKYFSPAQVVELAVKLMGFSSDKVMVALGLDLEEVQTFTMD
jgi:hypothetical protein